MAKYKRALHVPKDFRLPWNADFFQRSSLYDLFKKYDVDYREVDTEAVLDPTLTYEENRQILERHLQKLTGKREEVMTPTELRREIQRYRAMQREWEAEMKRRGEDWILAL